EQGQRGGQVGMLLRHEAHARSSFDPVAHDDPPLPLQRAMTEGHIVHVTGRSIGRRKVDADATAGLFGPQGHVERVVSALDDRPDFPGARRRQSGKRWQRDGKTSNQGEQYSKHAVHDGVLLRGRCRTAEPPSALCKTVRAKTLLQRGEPSKGRPRFPYKRPLPMSLRNVAIIAHVDHGKTTLVDQLLRQSGTFRDNQRVEERAMDSNDLEKERGITILAKPTSVEWAPDGGNETYRINIVDTPGHADFGAEVERILSMVDGVILLVDAAEGPMPQTKFVTGKALGLGLRPIVVINKIDRPDARADEVLNEVFDLFVALDANDEQLDFPCLYASGRAGYASADPDKRSGDLVELFEVIVGHIPEPGKPVDGEFTMLATLLDRDPFLGRILTGRIESGRLEVNMPIKAIDVDGNPVEEGRATKVFAYRGLERVPVETAGAGDIVAIAGLTKATVSNTLATPTVTAPIAARPIDPPTLAMTFGVNDSPYAGREGDKVQSRVIRDRLEREAEGNVAIRVTESAGKDAFEVAGRGE